MNMFNRVRVIMTQLGMEKLQKPLSFGYLISKKGEFAYILPDDYSTILKYSRNFWKAYHAEESHLY
jgi:hypothetical protein